MARVHSLADHRAARARRELPRPRVSFAFDLASPWTYLAAERVDRLFTGVHWRPAFGDDLGGACLAVAGSTEIGTRAEREAVERRAVQLRLPLVWPDHAPDGRQAMRVAAFAAERERAAAFVLAAGRLTFCGGYDLDDPETLAEAAAAAGLGLREALAAAADHGRDGMLEAAARRMLARGADALPALQVGRTLFCGEHRIAEAAAAAGAVARPRQIAR
jgi:2-hydroxychromene-2-carboxylate isomerase